MAEKLYVAYAVTLAKEAGCMSKLLSKDHCTGAVMLRKLAAYIG